MRERDSCRKKDEKAYKPVCATKEYNLADIATLTVESTAAKYSTVRLGTTRTPSSPLAFDLPGKELQVQYSSPDDVEPLMELLSTKVSYSPLDGLLSTEGEIASIEREGDDLQPASLRIVLLATPDIPPRMRVAVLRKVLATTLQHRKRSIRVVDITLPEDGPSFPGLEGEGSNVRERDGESNVGGTRGRRRAATTVELLKEPAAQAAGPAEQPAMEQQTASNDEQKVFTRKGTANVRIEELLSSLWFFSVSYSNCAFMLLCLCL